ncbi:MAG: hypothetical protein JWO94_1864 [Verrucomicrobiaceae bacterium]|nr:hypothetical protein [Verrucomicrobiaceae bacterium]
MRGLTTTESKNVRFAITTSVVVHLLLLLALAWFMGLSAPARLLLSQQLHATEVPKVTMMFPEQFVPTPKLRPRRDLNSFIRTSQNSPSVDKPTKSDFMSDHNTSAASNTAPFPDGDKAMPSSRGDPRAAPELVDREFHDGKTAGDNRKNTLVDPLHPAVSPLQPQEPTTVPVLKPKAREVARADASATAKMIEDTDKEAGRMDVTKLPLQVKKAEPALQSPVAVPKDSPADFTPFTRKSAVKGTITNNGATSGELSVNAEATPLGKFRSAVTSAVEKKWNEYRLKHAGAVTSGFLRLHFFVNRAGHVEEPEFVEKSSDPLIQDFTLDAILAAELPPIPQDVLPFAEEGRIPFEYSIIIND